MMITEEYTMSDKYDKESTRWIEDNEMLIRSCSHKFGYGSADDWFGAACLHIPKIMTKWKEKNPTKPILKSYIITSLKNKAKDLDKTTKIHNADLNFGIYEEDITVLDNKLSTELKITGDLTQQIFINKNGYTEIVESYDGQINNRLTLGVVNQIYIEDKDGTVEITEIN